jgi:exonuclease VII small subunit
MTDHNLPATVSATARSDAAAREEGHGSPRRWTALAIVMSSVALLIQFTPALQRQIMDIIGASPFAAVLSGSGAARVSSSANISSLESDVAHLEESIASLKAVASSDDDASKALQQLEDRIAVLEGATQAFRNEMEASVAQIRKVVDVIARPGELPLVAARIALRHAAGSLDRNDAAVLAKLAADEPSLIEPVARLKVLADRDIPTLSALRDAYHEQRQAAAAMARRARLDWWQVPVSYARSGLSDWGMSRPAAEEKDQAVIRSVSDELDAGRLERALFELQAGSLELRAELSSWESAARLRLALDQAILEIVDGVLNGLSPAVGVQAPH